MKNELFSIGRFTVHGYGLMLGLGIAAAYLIFSRRAADKGFTQADGFRLFLRCLAGGIAGAKLLFLLTQWGKPHPASLWEAIAGGFVFYGGVLGGGLACATARDRYPVKGRECLDLFAPPLALAQGIGRIGCFLAGCCYGIQTPEGWGVVFSHSEYAPNGIPLLPVQLIASGLDFLLFFLLIAGEKRSFFPGRVAGAYLLCYSAGRFLLEFLRGDAIRGQILFLSTSQFLSVFFFALGLWLLFPGKAGRPPLRNKQS